MAPTDEIGGPQHLQRDVVTSDDHRARRSAADQWSRHPAGTTLVDLEEGSAEFFSEMSRVRYDLQPWHRALLDAFAPTGRLLEIGSGAGTDHWELARLADETVAIDLAQRGAWLTKRRLELYGLSGRTLVADGESLPFDGATFDEVYSFGVIHHTDHPESVASEMYRVMGPGGRFLVALYNRWSLFAFRSFAVWIAKGVIRAQRWSEFLALIEAGANECKEKPTVRLYSRRRALRLFSRFEGVETSSCHFGMCNTSLLGSLPTTTQERLARRWGWYVVVTGSKPACEGGGFEGSQRKSRSSDPPASL